MHPLLALFGSFGGIELIIVLAVVLLLFGHRLPSAMRSLGLGISEFKKGIRDDHQTTPSQPSLPRESQDVP